MNKIEFEVKSKAGHSYNETWIKTNYFCPRCGGKNSWAEDSGGGDYYLGEQHRCNDCTYEFYLQGYLPHDDNWLASQREDAFYRIIGDE